MELITSLGEWIRRRRKTLDLTQPALAQCVGCAVITIQKIEADERRPSEQMAERLVECLAIPTSERSTFLQSARAERSPDRLSAPTLDLPLPVATPFVHNLPALATAVIGRTEELTDLLAWLSQPTSNQSMVRLLTLVGPGGVGKTTLALALAHVIAGADHGASQPLESLRGATPKPAEDGLRARFPDGIWLAELASLSDPALLAQIVATPFGLPQQSTHSYGDALASYLKSKRLVLVLDNCEHLLDACASLCQKLLRASPGLLLLATSREPLNLSGERQWRVPPLKTPELPLGRKSALKAAEIAESAAVQFFVNRARLVLPSFALADPNALAITRICQRLDGLPLALELAAARLKSLSVDAISTRLSSDLDARFSLLTSGHRTALPHQQTLRATLDWSYALLNDGERHLLQALAVFAGGFTLAAAEGITNDEAGIKQGESSDSVIGLLASLVDKSLVVARADAEDGMRYHLLETIRQYAWEKLLENGMADQLRQRHLHWFARWLDEADQGFKGYEQALWLARLDREQDNCRAALTASLELGQQPSGLQLLIKLWYFWSVRGYWGEQREWLQRFQLSEESAPRDAIGVRALALAASQTASGHTRRKLFAASLSLAEQLGDQAGLAITLMHQADVAWWHNTTQAHHYFEQSLAIGRAIGDRWHVANVLRKFGEFAYTRLDDRAAARQHMNESLHLFRQLGDRYGIADALVHLADVAFEQGDLAAALLYGDEGLALSRTLGFTYGILWGVMVVGSARGGQGDFAQSVLLLEECVVIARELGAPIFIEISLYWLATTWRLQGDLAQAARIYEECLALAQAEKEKPLVASSVYGLGEIARKRGDNILANTLLTQALTIWQEGTYPWGVARAQTAFGLVAVAQAQWHQATRLLSAAEACRRTSLLGFTPLEQAEVDHALALLQRNLSDTDFAAAWAEGQTRQLTGDENS